jgi:hypothetical protein
MFTVSQNRPDSTKKYFLARERSFQIMIEDLLKRRETSQNDRHPLVLSADVPRLKHIAHKKMGYLRATCCLFRDTVSGTEKDNIALVKLHMPMCVRHDHALIPQLDLVATQWGIDAMSPKLRRRRVRVSQNRAPPEVAEATQRSKLRQERRAKEWRQVRKSRAGLITNRPTDTSWPGNDHSR